MPDVPSKLPGLGHPPMVRLGGPGVMTRVRPGAHGGAGRGAQILLGGAGRKSAPHPQAAECRQSREC
jgi:hypothetical protein